MKKLIISGILLLAFTELNAITGGTGEKQMYNEVQKVVHSIYPKAKNIKWQCKKFNQLSLSATTRVYYSCMAKTKYKKKIVMECTEVYDTFGGLSTDCKFTRYIR